MAIDNFNPTIWSGVLVNKLEQELVFGAVVNTDYEGVISRLGSSVKINSFEDPVIGDYVKNTKIADPQYLEGSDLSLVIDQAEYFNFQIDDIDTAQQDPKIMTQVMERAAYKLRDVADRYIAGLYTGAGLANLIGTDAAPIALTEENVYSTFVAMRTRLANAGVPTNGRWAVVSPDVYALLLLDRRFTMATAQGEATIANGRVGNVAGFTIYESNNVAEVAGNQKIMYGQTDAITFASQIMKVEAYRPQDTFSDAAKGLHVYGAKVVRPESLGVLTATVAGL